MYASFGCMRIQVLLTNIEQVLAAVAVHLIRALPRPLLSPALLSRISSSFPRDASGRPCISDTTAVASLAQAFQDLLAEQADGGEDLEVLVQVAWLLSHLASAVTAQDSLDRRTKALSPTTASSATPKAQELAEELAEPLAGRRQNASDVLPVAVLAVLISHYDQVLEGQINYSDDDEPKPDPQSESLRPASPLIEARAADRPLPQTELRDTVEAHTPVESLQGAPQGLLPAPTAPAEQDTVLPEASPSAIASPAAMATAPAPESPPDKDPQLPAAMLQRPSLHSALEEVDAASAVANALERGGDVNEANEQGFTVLMVACSLGMVDVVQILLGAGAQVHLTDTQGLTAVHIAVVGRDGDDRCYEQVLHLLLSRSTQLGLGLAQIATVVNGDTPLHFMAQMAEEHTFRPETDSSMIRMLVGAGASLLALNQHQQTPEQIAVQNGASSLAAALAVARRTPSRPSTKHSPKPSPASKPTSPGMPLSPALSARSAKSVDSVLSDAAVERRLQEGEGVPGALYEGLLHLLDKKIKDWVETYYAIVPMLTDKKGTGHGDFAYMLHSASSKTEAVAGRWLDKINLHGAQVTILQGTVFTLKNSPEVGKSRVFRLSADTLNDVRGWFSAFEGIDGVTVAWENGEFVFCFFPFSGCSSCACMRPEDSSALSVRVCASICLFVWILTCIHRHRQRRVSES